LILNLLLMRSVLRAAQYAAGLTGRVQHRLDFLCLSGLVVYYAIA
jgi:hypothetical protein